MKNGQRKVELILTFSLLALIAMFFLSLFKNIAYPLLWNDESETVMHGVRVLEYGYPKVHDGKNLVCPLNYPDINLWINKKTDAYIATGWGHAYFVAPFIVLADKFDNIYTKTAILRSAFASAGLVGLIIFAAIISAAFTNRKYRLAALSAFALFQLLSISLTLHLREVRYYSLVILLVAIILSLYWRLSYQKRISLKFYTAVTALSLILLFNTFYPVYFILFLAVAFNQFWDFLDRASSNEKMMKEIAKEDVGALYPYLISLLLLVPFLIFFQTFKINAIFSGYFGDGLSYLAKLRDVLSFFTKFDFFYLVLFIKLLLVALSPKSAIKLSPEEKTRQRFSNFLTLFFVIYVLVIAKSFLIFERYFIVLVPVLALICIFDLSLAAKLVFQKSVFDNRKVPISITVFFVIIAVFSLGPKIPSIKGHAAEIFAPYKGPLDYAIPYIRSNYKETDKLVIATNYEETAYMYYLGSKTIIGYVGNNLENDLKEKPDIVIYRKSWSHNPEIFNHFLRQGKFQQVSFPVYDSAVNNIPELNHKQFVHQFRSLLPKDNNQFEIYVRDKES